MIEVSIEEPSVLVLSESPKKTHEFSNILKLVKKQSNLVIQRVIILFVDYPDARLPYFLIDHHLSISPLEEKHGHLRETMS